MENKTEMIKFRIESDKKKLWKKICSERKITLSQLIVDSVERKLLRDERRKVLAFIEKQDNIFSKIENNINQTARIANGQKFISEYELSRFSQSLEEIIDLKKTQNNIFRQIYDLLYNDN